MLGVKERNGRNSVLHMQMWKTDNLF